MSQVFFWEIFLTRTIFSRGQFLREVLSTRRRSSGNILTVLPVALRTRSRRATDSAKPPITSVLTLVIPELVQLDAVRTAAAPRAHQHRQQGKFTGARHVVFRFSELRCARPSAARKHLIVSARPSRLIYDDPNRGVCARATGPLLLAPGHPASVSRKKKDH